VPHATVTPLERPEHFGIEYGGDLPCGWEQRGREGKGEHASGGVGSRVRSVRQDVSKCSKVDMSGVGSMSEKCHVACQQQSGDGDGTKKEEKRAKAAVTCVIAHGKFLLSAISGECHGECKL
jgi:hypothetical protein